MFGRKLESKKGASITFALLLFLVCAVVSAVVIVAATTASGRMSNLPDIDQRYYAVSSAAELLRTAIDKQAVTVVKNQTVSTTTAYNSDGNEVPATDEKPNPKEVKGVPSTEIYLGSTGLIDNPSEYTLLMTLAATLTADTPPTAPSYTKHTLTANGSIDTDLDPNALLSVDIYQQLDVDGTLTFYVSKKVSDTAAAYTLRMIFAAERTENTVSHVEHGAPVLTDAAGSYTITDVETKTVTVTYKWTLTQVEKSVVPNEFGST